MSDIENRLMLAQKDAREMDCLLTDYLPFIKKQLDGMSILPLEYDDMLSIAMITFVNCVRQYTTGRGAFISFYQKVLKNRITDEIRHQQRHNVRVIPLFRTGHNNDEQPLDTSASIDTYRREEERLGLSLEIDSFSTQLSEYGIAFSELVHISPKQQRSRAQCMKLAKAIAGNDIFVHMLTKQHRLPQSELAVTYCISPKTIEKHRKYIVVLTLLLLGDYPGIKTFLPIYGE